LTPENVVIHYRFTLPEGKEENFVIELDPETLISTHESSKKLPEWTELDFHKCSNCPLDSLEHPHCPLAVHLEDVVEPFGRLMSFDVIQVEIVTKERKVSQETTVQKALSSIMGLLIATSGCPHTAFFRSLARYHRPLATLEESVFRLISTYLLAQYFAKKEGMKVDFEFEGLKKICEEMHVVNAATVNRLSVAGETDSTLNGLVRLDMYTKALPLVIEESLADLKFMFEPILEQFRQASQE